jgi:hypothetical protein
MGAGIWKATVGGSVSLKNKSKFAAQREGKKNDALTLKTILSGLSSPIKESMRQCTSAKDLWLKLEETYQSKKENIEDHSIKIIKGKESTKTLDCIISKCDDVGKNEHLEDISNEGKESCDDVGKKEDLEDNSNEGKESCDDVGKKEDLEDISNEGKESPQTLDCNNSKCDDVEFFSTSEEKNLEIVCIKSIDFYPMEEVEEKLSELKEKVERGLYEYRNDHYYIDYSYLLDNTKFFFKKSQKHILKLKEMLKEQKESNKTQLDEKEEEITRLKNEKEDKKVDDDIRIFFEIIFHLKTQIEEAKMVEELLKNKINEKE